MAQEMTTGVGRIVWGHPGKAQPKTNKDTKQPLFDAQGQPRKAWAFGVAFPKHEYEQFIAPFFAAEAATIFPSGTPQKFSWKITDGDGIDGEGKPYNLREGYAGCMVVSFSTEAFAPPVVKFNPATGGYDAVPTDGIKCGDYVVVRALVKANMPTDRTHTPGLYVNPQMVEFVGWGTEIVSVGAVDPMAAFGGRQHALPPGASATPIAPASGVNPGALAPQPQPQPGYSPQQQMPAPQPGYSPQQQMPAPQPGYPQQQQMPAPQPGYPPQQQMPAPQPGYPQQQQMPAPQPGYPQQQQMPAPQPGYPQQQQMPAPQPGYPPPAHDFVQNAGMQPGMMPPR